MTTAKYVAARWGEDNSVTLVYDDVTGEIESIEVVNTSKENVGVTVTNTQTGKSFEKSFSDTDKAPEVIAQADRAVFDASKGRIARPGQNLSVEIRVPG